MKSQHTQSAHGQGDWDRSRNEMDPRSASEQGRPYARSAPEHYPESHQQYQAQREHPGSEYFSGSPGYGGRSDYPQQQQGQGSYGGQQQGYGSQQQGSQQQGYGGSFGSRSESERGQGSYRQQEAFQSSSGRQQGFGGEDFGRGGYGGYGREEQGQQFGGQYGQGQHRETQSSQYGRGSFEERPFESGSYQQHPNYGQFAGQGGYQGQSQAGQASQFGGHYPEHSPGSAGQASQGYGGFQSGQPQSYGAAESGQFMAQSGYPSGGQFSGGYGSYGAYQVGTQQQGLQGRAPRAPKDYVRSDERIRELICENLAHHPAIDASEVSVQVNQGRVILEGNVPMRRMKHEIEDVADSCWGVKDVENHIRVQSGQESNLGSTAQSFMAAPADVATGGASTRASTGRTSATDMSPTETGSGTSMTGAAGSTTASSRKPAGMESKTKGKE